MKKVLIVLLLAAAVFAQLPYEITDLRCGNDKLDQFEMCERGMGDGYCDDLFTMLKIDGACDIAHCTCLPRVNAAYCGNDIREGIEVCDGSGEDKCAELGTVLNLSLKCDPKKCTCAINETLPADYDPLIIEQLENASGKASSCGDKKVERAEDCDPPDTLCTTNKKEPGICTEKCKCLTAAELAEAEKPVQEEVKNESVETNVSETNLTESPAVNETVSEVPEEPGFFSRVWSWIVGLFS